MLNPASMDPDVDVQSPRARLYTALPCRRGRRVVFLARGRPLVFLRHADAMRQKGKSHERRSAISSLVWRKGAFHGSGANGRTKQWMSGTLRVIRGYSGPSNSSSVHVCGRRPEAIA